MHALRGSWEEIHLMECKIANSLSNKFENVYFILKIKIVIDVVIKIDIKFESCFNILVAWLQPSLLSQIQYHILVRNVP